jgi:protein O-GlcNAc transferase
LGDEKKWVSVYKRSATNKITIGYLSNNYKNHPTSHLIGDIFDCHDKTQFTVNAYSYGEDDGSPYRLKVETTADKFVDLRPCSNEEAAQCISHDKVDILVDLVGYMRGCRLEICGYRPAPVQVRWLGMAGTTGSDFFDYIIADRTVIPEAHSAYYSEKPVYMPDCYQMNSKPLNLSDRAFTRQELGLPRDGFVYCCFCSSYKIEPTMFGAWMAILRGVPGSVLWLLKSNEIVEDNLKKEAHKHGIDPKRLVFADKMNKADHLERIKCADLCLDTRIVNGAATTSDALFAGVPVITLKGGHFASRMAASINRAIGLDALVTENSADYLALAVALGKDSRQYKAFKTRLQSNLDVGPLFNGPFFVQYLEKAYRKMWTRYLSGGQPEIIRLNYT